MTLPHLVLGVLWLVVLFAWLLLPPFLHLWRSGRCRDRSPLDGRARDGLNGRIVFILVIVVWELAVFWESWAVLYGGAFVVIVFLLLKQFCRQLARRFLGKDKEEPVQFSERYDAFARPEGKVFESLGPCDEEAEGVLTDEVMLSLWYGGLNRIYVRKFRSVGRWLFQLHGYTPTEFLRSWASDNPHLRAFAYYGKAMAWCFFIVVLSVLFVSRTSMVYSGFWDEGFSREAYSGITLFWYIFAWFFYVMPIPSILAYLTCREWLGHYRALSRALREGLDPDLSDRARMGELRRTILGWAWNSGYVRYDREKGWRLNAPSKGAKGGRLVG